MRVYCPYFVVEGEVLRLELEGEVAVDADPDGVEGLGLGAGLPERS